MKPVYSDMPTVVKGKRLRKFYYLSLLCLIPGFGILIGIVLLCYAIFVFRNLKLIFVILLTIGAGILLLKLDGYYLSRDLKYGKEHDNDFSLLAADDLDKIVQHLDLYKLQHGGYPDSLQQLQKQDPTLNIMDPLLGRNSEAHKFINYYYQRKDDSYILFSSGIDGIPNTKDDIYPRKAIK